MNSVTVVNYIHILFITTANTNMWK